MLIKGMDDGECGNVGAQARVHKGQRQAQNRQISDLHNFTSNYVSNHYSFLPIKATKELCDLLHTYIEFGSREQTWHMFRESLVWKLLAR